MKRVFNLHPPDCHNPLLLHWGLHFLLLPSAVLWWLFQLQWRLCCSSYTLPACSALGPGEAPLLTIPVAVLTPWQGMVFVGVIWILLLPVPTRAPLLAWLGGVTCKVEFPSLVFLSIAEVPCVFPCSFLACDLTIWCVLQVS